MHSPLCTLPAELLFEIISHLDGGDLLRAGCSCRKLYAVAIPILYRFISLGFYGVERALRYPALGSSPSSPLQTFRVLRALENPELARHAIFLDHVDSPLPTFTRISSRRVPEEILFIQQHMAIPPPPPPPPLVLAPIPNGGGVSPAVLGPVSNGRDVTSTSAPYSRHHDFVESELDLTLYKAMESLSTARVKTIRIVSGSDSLVQALLKYVVQRPDCVQKLWLEDVAPLVLRRFLVDQVDFWNDKACTGLTHFRLRKLKATGLRRLFHNLDTTQNNSIPMFLDLMLSRSPSLTSLALDHIQNLEMLPEILAPLTFPNLTAFQLRSQTEDSCPAPYFLTDKRLLNFLLRHPNIKAFGWPAESFVPYESEVPQLSPLLDQFSRRLVWFRSDCSLLDSTTQHQSRYIGPPQTSRNFVAHFLRRMEFLETIKLQGDYQVDELVAIIKAIEESDSSNKMLKFSLIRAHVEASVLTPIAKSMPNLRELKLCAYFTPGLVSMYDTAPQIAQEIDGGLVPNISLETFLSHIGGLKHLHTLTIPFHSGLNMSDRVISDTWDEYRELHPTTPSFVSHPHFKPMASEIDMFQDAAQTLVLANGIERQPDAGQDLEVAAVQPPAVVRHLMQHLRKASREMGGLRELRTLRGFFILALEWRSLDINEYLIDVKWREGSEEEEGKDDVLGLAEGLGGLAIGDDEKRGRLEVNRSPVLAYGWGTGLWLGDTKKLADRAWF